MLIQLYLGCGGRENASAMTDESCTWNSGCRRTAIFLSLPWVPDLFLLLNVRGEANWREWVAIKNAFCRVFFKEISGSLPLCKCLLNNVPWSLPESKLNSSLWYLVICHSQARWWNTEGILNSPQFLAKRINEMQTTTPHKIARVLLL